MPQSYLVDGEAPGVEPFHGFQVARDARARDLPPGVEDALTLQTTPAHLSGQSNEHSMDSRSGL